MGQDEASQIAQRALAVRRAGTRLITETGGQFIHPVKAVVGGMTSGITPEVAETLAGELSAQLAPACELFDLYIQKSVELSKHFGTMGDDGPGYYLAAVSYTIAAGTSEVQRNIIAQRGLGLPRD